MKPNQVCKKVKTNVDTTKAITHVSLCAGYGGIDIGLKRCLPTLRTILVSEIEAYAVANLVAKMEAGELDPCPIWTDLKTLPLDSIPENISILSGGFPCQPFSAAGKREGDKDPRHLFPYIKNAIRTIQPQWVFLENVEGIISAKLKSDGWADPAGTPVLLHVLRELERVGYRATAGVFSAAEVGATHQRKRVFILAHSKCSRFKSRRDNTRAQEESESVHSGKTTELAHSGSTRSSVRLSEPQQWKEGNAEVFDYRSYRNWPARPGETQHEWEEPRVVGDAEGRQVHSGESGELGEAAQRGESESTTVADPSAELGDADCTGSQERAREPSSAVQGINPASGAKDKRQTQSQLGGATDGSTSGLDPTANRVDRLRLLGNGVVPATAAKAWIDLNNKLNAHL